MLDDKKITNDEYKTIADIVERASIIDYRPLIYIIPAYLTNGKIEKVPVELTANSLGIEYRIPNLLEGEFEILEIKS